jgi:hypothetical protein
MMIRGTCKVCGCTNNNACVTEAGPCWWADEHENLCSACVDNEEENIND